MVLVDEGLFPTIKIALSGANEYRYSRAYICCPGVSNYFSDLVSYHETTASTDGLESINACC